MKKVLYLVIISLLMVSGATAQANAKNVSNIFVTPQTGGAATEAVVAVTAPTANIETGTNFTIPVTVSDTTGLGIIAYQFDLHYDPAVIQPQANPIDVAGTVSSGLAVVYNPISPGILKVVLYGAHPLAGAGTLLNFKFTAVGPATAVSPLTWVNFMFNEGNPGAAALNGQVKLFSSGSMVAGFSGRETIAGSRDILNNIYRNNTFVLISDDPANASSLTLSFDLGPVAGQPGKYSVVNGDWSLTVFREGRYVGLLYGKMTRGGRVSDVLDNATGEILYRQANVHFRIMGGLGSYENTTVQIPDTDEFIMQVDYRNGRKTTATMNLF